MNFNKKIIYALITLIFIALTLIELIEFFLCDSSLFGFAYLLINFFLIFLLGMVTLNFDKAFKKYRISKIFIVIVIGFFSSFFLKNIIYSCLDYTVYSSTLENYIFLTKNILKPIIYALLTILNLLELNIVVKNKNNKGFLNLEICKTLVSKFRKDR